MKRIKTMSAAALLSFALLCGCSAGPGAQAPETKAPADTVAVESADDETESEDEEETLAEEEGVQAEAHEYNIYYYESIDAAEPSDQVTVAVYGTKTKILTIDELGFAQEGKVFEGWRMYRAMDNKWYLRNDNGKNHWTALEDGNLPEGTHWMLRKNGASLTKPAKEGDIYLYAQWGGESFEVFYHEDEDSEASVYTTVVPYGEKTATITIADLGFGQEGKEFAGWKAYREIDNKWYAVKNGKERWVKLTGGELPEGYKFVLLKDGRNLSKAATSGAVHLYGQWK